MLQQIRRFVVPFAILSAFLASAAIPAARAQCLGDCDDDDEVSTAEIVLGTEIALLEAPASECPAFGAEVAIDGLVTAVNNNLDGCPETPTPTPTATPTATETAIPTATDTPGAVSNAVAGGAAVVAKGFAGIPSLITAIVTGLTRGAAESGVGGEGGAAGACPLGGEATRTCEQAGLAVNIQLGLDDCAVQSADGGSLTLNTNSFPISLATATGQCPNVLVPPVNASADVVGTYRDGEGAVTLSSRTNVTAVINELVGGAPTCVVQNLRMTVTGSLSSTLPAGGTTILNLFQTIVSIVIHSYSTDCVPLEYTLTFNGPAEARDLTREPPQSAPLTFDNLVVEVDASGAMTTFELDGGLDFDCIDGAITLETVTALTAATGALCPTAGTLLITSPEGPATIRYNANGSVDVDVDNDGTFDNDFASCVDPMLQLCPE
jgi:hypothetical protein